MNKNNAIQRMATPRPQVKGSWNNWRIRSAMR